MKTDYKPNEYNKISLKSLELINNFVQKWMKKNYDKDFNGDIHDIPNYVWADMMCDLESVYDTKWEPKDKDIND
jgi:hypothetical protein